MFTYETENGYCTITGYSGTLPEVLRVPGTIDEFEVCSISEGAFRRCLFSEVILPPTVQMIGREAFEGCTNLKTINLDAVKIVRPDAFKGTQIQFGSYQ